MKDDKNSDGDGDRKKNQVNEKKKINEPKKCIQNSIWWKG